MPVLQLKSLGIDDVMKFEWITSPPTESMLRAFEGLIAAEMMRDDGRLTSMGERAAEFPLDVGFARMVGVRNTGHKSLIAQHSYCVQGTFDAERKY